VQSNRYIFEIRVQLEKGMSKWVNQAIQKIEADFQRSADTHLVKVPLPAPAFDGIDLYLKDESTHPTGSLKHRLARSLFLYALCNGKIQHNTTIIEASSGSTAVSEAYFANLLGLKFIAVVPKGTSKEKVAQIEFYQGQCHFVEPMELYAESEKLAKQTQGYYMDQFTFAERATDWRGNNNIADSIYQQMSMETFPIPKWLVVSAGTGGTSATIGRFIRYRGHETKLCVADPSNSVFYDYFKSNDVSITQNKSSCIEGIGRPRVEPSFIKDVIDEMVKVPDAAAYACIHFLETILNRRCGGSTGTNLFAVFKLIEKMVKKGEKGSVVSMICDSGDRYLNTYYNSVWLSEQGVLKDLEKYRKQLKHFYSDGQGLG